MSNSNRGGARPGAGRKPGKVSDNPKMTTKHIAGLLQSPYVAFISSSTVSYTAEFKELFWQRYTDGVHPFQIFLDAGLPPDAVGHGRINGFVKTLRDQKAKGLTFNDGREPHVDQPEKQFAIPKPPRRPKADLYITQDEAGKLMHQIAYLTQEVEFLKKILLTEREVK
ncbi:MAG: hypothetical protein LBP79_05270 [Clostridiales bacterium]|jgi:hypothetical protein|nr:hypothetical protein [Clostridiales bacterium]